MVNPGGLEPPAAGLKVPCPADPGFTLGVLSNPAFVWCHALLHRFDEVVQAGGVEPPATRLSAEALAVRTGLRNRGRKTNDRRRKINVARHLSSELVPLQGFEPQISVCRTDALDH